MKKSVVEQMLEIYQELTPSNQDRLMTMVKEAQIAETVPSEQPSNDDSQVTSVQVFPS